LIFIELLCADRDPLADDRPVPNSRHSRPADNCAGSGFLTRLQEDIASLVCVAQSGHELPRIFLSIFSRPIDSSGRAFAIGRGAFSLWRSARNNTATFVDNLANWIKELPKPIGVMACYDFRAQQVPRS